MWSLALAIFIFCKAATWTGAGVRADSPWKSVAFLLAWPGLDARAFLSRRPPEQIQRVTRWEWIGAASKTLLGLIVFFVIPPYLTPIHPYLLGWIGMLGIVLTLHFGLFHLLSCGWRRVKIAARPLMDWPIASTSLGEFWGRRWNTAFRDITHRFLFRPLVRRLGPRWAVVVGFVVSGLIHDAVISLPAGGGYGGPTLFFLIQATGMLVERSRVGRRMGLGRGCRGWCFAMVLLVGPVVLLFHPPFVVNVVVPFMRAVGAVGAVGAVPG